MKWVLEDAPDFPPHLLGVLMGLANKADSGGRAAWPGQATLAQWAKKGERAARKDLAQLEELKLIRRGDQSLVAHLAADERPVVWDLAMERTRELEGNCSSARNHSSGGNPEPGPDNTADEGISGGTVVPGGTTDPGGTVGQREGNHSSADTSGDTPGGSLPTGENTNAGTRDTGSGGTKQPRRRRTKAERDELDQQAQDLAKKFRERYKNSQRFVAIMTVIRGALGNGFTRDEVAFALDRLGREKKPVSGASIQFAHGQIEEERERAAVRTDRARASPRPAEPLPARGSYDASKVFGNRNRS